MPTNSLEPRVAKVEAELESVAKDIGQITSDVRSLASSVRQQSENFDNQLRQLHIAVTTASGPRKTDWQVVLSTIVVGLAVGTAALSPLYSRMGDMSVKLEQQSSHMRDHEKMKMHPVGETRVDGIEKLMLMEQKRLDGELHVLVENIKDMKDKSVPSIVERLAMIEEKIKVDMREARQ